MKKKKLKAELTKTRKKLDEAKAKLKDLLPAKTAKAPTEAKPEPKKAPETKAEPKPAAPAKRAKPARAKKT